MELRKIAVSILLGIVFMIIVATFYYTFSLDDGYQIMSQVYSIKDGMIEDISPYTSVSLFKKYFDLENCSLRVVDTENHEIKDGYVFSGSTTILEDSNGKVIATYVNVIKGDVWGDGVIDKKDLETFGHYLVNGNSLALYQRGAMDVDLDGEVHVNDLVLLDKTMNSSYEELSLDVSEFVLQTNESRRIIATIKPKFILNQNLQWTSSDEKVVEVDESGKVIGHEEGETTILATTMDGKLTSEVKVVVDNTIQLAATDGVGYVNGNDVVVDIKSVDYEGITCSSSNASSASCQILDKQLVVTALGEGTSNITVSSPQYGSVIYHFVSHSVYFNVMPKYLCTKPGNQHLITVTAFHSGELSFSSSNPGVIQDAYMTDYSGRKMLKIVIGPDAGRATLKVSEGNGNSSNIVTIDTYRLSIPAIGGVAKKGEELTTTIVGENLGNLSCSSSSKEKATCVIEGNQLKVTPLMVGDVTIQVQNKFLYNDQEYDCGEATFLVLIRE